MSIPGKKTLRQYNTETKQYEDITIDEFDRRVAGKLSNTLKPEDVPSSTTSRTAFDAHHGTKDYPYYTEDDWEHAFSKIHTQNTEVKLIPDDGDGDKLVDKPENKYTLAYFKEIYDTACLNSEQAADVKGFTGADWEAHGYTENGMCLDSWCAQASNHPTQGFLFCTEKATKTPRVKMYDVLKNQAPVKTPEEYQALGYTQYGCCQLGTCVLCYDHPKRGRLACCFKREEMTEQDKKDFEHYTHRNDSTYGKSNSSSTSSGYSGHSSNTYVSTWCRHEPTIAFEIADQGISYFGGSESKVTDSAFDGLVVCLLNKKSMAEAEKPVVANNGWTEGLESFFEVKVKVKEFMTLDWPDMSAPPVKAGFWKALHEKVRTRGIKKVLFYCMGGHGRTGTALASTMIEVCGFTPKKAQEWIHEYYCQKAIESGSQREYLNTLWKAKHEGMELKDEDKLESSSYSYKGTSSSTHTTPSSTPSTLDDWRSRFEDYP